MRPIKIAGKPYKCEFDVDDRERIEQHTQKSLPQAVYTELLPDQLAVVTAGLRRQHDLKLADVREIVFDHIRGGHKPTWSSTFREFMFEIHGTFELLGYGITPEQMCLAIGMDRKELEEGKDEADSPAEGAEPASTEPDSS